MTTTHIPMVIYVFISKKLTPPTKPRGAHQLSLYFRHWLILSAHASYIVLLSAQLRPSHPVQPHICDVQATAELRGKYQPALSIR